MHKQFRYCKEDEFQSWSIMMNIVPFARTPLSKDTGKAMHRAETDFRKSLMGGITPWRNAHEERRKQYKKKYGIESGEIAIVYGKGEAGLAKDLANKGTKVVKG